MGHQSSEQLEKLILAAKQKITVGQIYSHYKDTNKRYRIIAIALDESSESVSIVYEGLYAPYLTWIRPLNNFLESVTWQDKSVLRFQLNQTSKTIVTEDTTTNQ